MFLYGDVIQYRYRIGGHIKQEGNNMKALNDITAQVCAVLLATVLMGFEAGVVNFDEMVGGVIVCVTALLYFFFQEH